MSNLIKTGFWGKLKPPIYAMAPMADVTDAPYRFMIAKYSKPDILFTEFVSADGLCSRGKDNLMKYLLYDKIERPIVIQIFGRNPETFHKSAQIAQELKFDGVDINMGCPVKTVTKTGSGAALINTPELAKELINATIEGSGDLPVSVKTRIGYNAIAIDEWMACLLETNIAAITLHLRTKKEMSNVDAHWEVAGQAAKLAKDSGTLVLANGDLKDLNHADEMIEKTGIDGVMMGRAIFGFPWLFDRTRTNDNVSVEEKLSAMIEHACLYENIFESKNNFAVMIKHLRAYASGFDGAKELRVMMEHVSNAKDVQEKIDMFRSKFHITPETFSRTTN